MWFECVQIVINETEALSLLGGVVSRQPSAVTLRAARREAERAAVRLRRRLPRADLGLVYLERIYFIQFYMILSALVQTVAFTTIFC